MTTENGAGLAGFMTARLKIFHWKEWLKDNDKRKKLGGRLAEILTIPVLAHLPPSLQLSSAGNAVEAWIAGRAAESDVYLVVAQADSQIIGLLFLVNLPEKSGIDTIHLGYLLAESAWGKGFATELVSGLVAAMRFENAAQFVGGVGKNNVASAKVLLKSGFKRSEALSTPDTDNFIFSVPNPD